ncbi:MAG: hypothetical protein GF401_01190 [Chitinivibrionales bacterium]|nr:hypothetical protein [Chitinivibrionales bacterium]
MENQNIKNSPFSRSIQSPCITIDVPAYLTPWDVEDVIFKSLRKMDRADAVYIIDFSSVKNIYSATAKLILRLYDRAKRLNAPLHIANTCQPVQNALKTLKIDERVPVMDEVAVM